MKVFSTLSISIIFSVLFFSCQKPHTEGPASNDHYLRYKLNGVLVTNTVNHVWLKPNSQDPTQMMFQLFSNTNDFKNFLGLTIQQTGNIGIGTYESVNNPLYFIVDYFQDSGQPNEKDFSIQNAPGNPPSTFTIVLTSVTTTEIKGTFTGNYLYEWTTHEMISITDGEFCVRRTL